MLSCLAEGNIPWAQRAPVLILSVAKLQFARNQKANRHALHDVGLATTNLILQATSLGLVAHAIAGFRAERARGVFGIPEDSEPVAMIAVGYLGDANTLPQALLERELAPRTRKPLEEFVFTSRWGQASPLVLAEQSSKEATSDISSATPPLLGYDADGNEDCSRRP